MTDNKSQFDRKKAMREGKKRRKEKSEFSWLWFRFSRIFFLISVVTLFSMAVITD
jgi:hypothetical protein